MARKTDKSSKTPHSGKAAEAATHKPAFPVVAVGASAGGLEAYTRLLQNLPVDTGMAFVLVQHLDPRHVSLLPGLLSRATAMPVAEVKDGMRLEPNHIYVLPPNYSLALLHGVLHLLPRDGHGKHLPIDDFMRSLADDQKSNAIGVILSGTASDGMLGLKDIKAAGGITFAQSEESAEYGGMPHSVIAAGHVDFILPPEGIAEELATINQEHEMHNQELVQANNDLTNLLASMDLAVLILSEDLRIRRFTPKAKTLLNLIDTDIDRPIGNIRPNVNVPDLEKRALEVIDTMSPQALEVQDKQGRWYELRIRPYKTMEQRIQGVVAVFIDITERKIEDLRQ